LSYAWIIDTDHMPDEDAPTGTNRNAAGVTGPSDAPEALLEALRSGGGIEFRIYDDDHELYYSGRWIGTDEIGSVESKEVVHCGGHAVTNLPEEAFGPLEDFGTPNAGATEIRYRTKEGTWAVL
jgi:hypothetical protein